MALEGAGGGGGARGVRAGGAYVELGVKDSMTAALKRMGNRFLEFGKQALALTPIGGLIGGLGFKETADDLKKMDSVAKAFGITGRQASGLFGVLGAAGGEFKENLEGVIQFSDTLSEALAGGDNQGAKLFEGLAVTAKELEGVAVDEQFYRVHDAIRKLPQPLQEAKLALLGGTDSMKQWQDLLVMSNEEVRKLAADLAISSAELEDAAAASKAMATAGAAVGRVWQQFVIMLAPVVKTVADELVKAMKPMIEWLKGRTLQDLWDEAVAYLLVGWEVLKQKGREVWLAIGGWFTDTWYDMEATGKVAFISLMEWIDKLLSKEFWSGLIKGFLVSLRTVGILLAKALKEWGLQALAFFAKLALAAANPLAAAAVLGDLAFKPVKQNADEIKKAAEEAQAEVDKVAEAGGEAVAGGKEQAWADAAAKKRIAAAARELELAEGQLEVEKALANLAQVQADIEARRKKRQEDEKPANKRVQEAVTKMGDALGQFGGRADFVVRGLGGGGGVEKKLEKNNDLLTKAVKVLEEIAKKVGFPKIR